MSETPLAVAEYFRRKAAIAGVALTPMKLIKLVYIAHGWHLGLANEPLVNEPIQAWKYGPVIDSLYQVLKVFGREEIPPHARISYSQLSDESRVAPLLDAVWNSYWKFSGGQLSTLTHQSGTPWDQIWNGQGGCAQMGAIIPNDIIQAHYKAKANG